MASLEQTQRDSLYKGGVAEEVASHSQFVSKKKKKKMRAQGLSMALVPLVVLAIAVSMAAKVEGEALVWPPTKLKLSFYKNTTCHEAEENIKWQVQKFWDLDKSITPKLIRLLYSDCFVQGCDGSILLDGENSEKNATQNRGLGAFVIIDKIKEVMEKRCPGVVSCADILNLATRDAVHLAGAPSYPVYTGRRDGLSSAPSVTLPSPSISHDQALAYFKSKGLNEEDMTTLLGAHTTGRTHCSFLADRLYNYNNTKKPDPSMDTSFLTYMRELCPPRETGQPDPIVLLNPGSVNYSFNESYYTRVLANKAVLGVDQQLLYGDASEQISEEFAAGLEDFRKGFAQAMNKMGSIGVLTGKQGEIRKNCRYRNK